MLGLRRSFVRRVLLAACVISFVGCGGGGKPGPKLYHVAGVVNFTGAPLKEGDMVVRSADGKHAAGATISDGKFQFDAPAGASIVEIKAMRDIPGEFREENPGEKVPVKEQYIPAKYNSESTLKLEIKGDVKDVKFDLEP
jgi:hypothetical protein